MQMTIFKQTCKRILIIRSRRLVVSIHVNTAWTGRIGPFIKKTTRTAATTLIELGQIMKVG